MHICNEIPPHPGHTGVQSRAFDADDNEAAVVQDDFYLVVFSPSPIIQIFELIYILNIFFVLYFFYCPFPAGFSSLILTFRCFILPLDTFIGKSNFRIPGVYIYTFIMHSKYFSCSYWLNSPGYFVMSSYSCPNLEHVCRYS